MLDSEKIIRDGFFVCNFDKLTVLTEIKAECERICREWFPDSFTSLEEYHNISCSQEKHEQLQYEIYSSLNRSKLHHQFAKENMDFFVSLFGADMDIQTNTYLRISRPGLEKDNIGIHRDTDYGNSAYEVSLSLPLVEQTQGAGLRVLPASHLMQEHKVQQVQREDVEKGSDKNEMGFLYAPKIPVSIKDGDLKEINLKFGQGVGFTLALLHGQKENTSEFTRWSVDFRVKNSFHPTTKNLKSGYYTPFVQSAITKVADDYYSINEQQLGELTYLNNRDKI